MATGKFYLACRETRRGAYTTMGGKRFDFSRSGNHWQEVVEVGVGDLIEITDISNSGKHNCRRLRVTKVNADGTVETEIAEAYDYYRDREHCPICCEGPF